MNYVLDSCAFVDFALGANTLTQASIDIYQNSSCDIYLSVASVWELGLKQSLGKLNFDITSAVGLLAQNNIKIIDITLPVALLVNQLPYIHKDPFDRIIVATAKFNDMAVITSDTVFKRYGITVIASR